MRFPVPSPVTVGILRVLLLSCSLFVVGPWAQAQFISVGLADDFEGGTTSGWAHAALNVNDPAVLAGGPHGASDHFLQVTSTGVSGQDGGRLTVRNQQQWAGNYTADAVTGLEMDLKAFSSSIGTLSIRVAVKDSTGSSGYVSQAFALPVDGQWHHATFTLTAGTMTPVNGPAALGTVLTAVSELRILDAALPDT